MEHVHHFVSLPADLYAELTELARQRGISLSDIVLESLLVNAEVHRRRALKAMPAAIVAEAQPALLLA